MQPVIICLILFLYPTFARKQILEKVTVLNLPKKPQLWFIAGDFHSYSCHKPSYNILLSHARMLPKEHRNLFINGDFVDFACFMPKNPDFQTWVSRKEGCDNYFIPEYEKEVNWANETLDELQEVFENIIYIQGNHCSPRVDLFRENYCPAGYKDNFHFIRDIGLAKRKIGWVNYNDWLDFGNLTLTHGMAHGSTCLKKHYELSGGRNVVFNHVHTAECKTFSSRGVTRAVWSMPSMASLNPHYIKNADTNWQNGYGTVSMKPNGNFNIHTHLIIDNELCLPTGEVLKG